MTGEFDFPDEFFHVFFRLHFFECWIKFSKDISIIYCSLGKLFGLEVFSGSGLKGVKGLNLLGLHRQ